MSAGWQLFLAVVPAFVLSAASFVAGVLKDRREELEEVEPS